MKAILVVDIPDEIWENKEEDMGMYAEVWSKRIDDGWCGEYYADSLKPIPKYYPSTSNPQRIEYLKQLGMTEKEQHYYELGHDDCIDEILGVEE